MGTRVVFPHPHHILYDQTSKLLQLDVAAVSLARPRCANAGTQGHLPEPSSPFFFSARIGIPPPSPRRSSLTPLGWRTEVSPRPGIPSPLCVPITALGIGKRPSPHQTERSPSRPRVAGPLHRLRARSTKGLQRAPSGRLHPLQIKGFSF